MMLQCLDIQGRFHTLGLVLRVVIVGACNLESEVDLSILETNIFGVDFEKEIQL